MLSVCLFNSFISKIFLIYSEALKTKVSRSANLAKLQAGYLFPEIARRKAAHMLKYPDAQVISLGIGDTTEPILEVITSAMAKRAYELSTQEGYSGYGAEQGEKGPWCRGKLYICFRWCKMQHFRLQVVFGSNVTMAVQDPSYPAYVDSSVIMGQTGQFQKDVEKYGNIEYMECSPENGFFPDLSTVAGTDIVFFCSPNNPTGAAATREQLTRLVQFAKDNGSIIVYDSAYAMYMSDDSPPSIFEIPGPKRLQLRHHHLASMLGSPKFIWAGLWFQKSFCFLMGFLSPETSTGLYVLALMVHPISPKLVVWLAFHLRASGLSLSVPRTTSYPGRVRMGARASTGTRVGARARA
ncbi:hypothetical protein LWI29_018377 [Acer saccharum]|uniref:Aminotransferase class I/classII large domain-containing protein n=1 Tax=Acer saccharum TaxID=4024 RepID=A0AA39RVB2_ACESA|nr:hypothetical protein LWI29_018377 [Acer saccharum]